MITFNENVLYTKSNEWVEKLGGVVRMGIDDYSQSSLGDIVYVEVADSGTHVAAGKSFGSVEATKSVSDINAPVVYSATKAALARRNSLTYILL